jgi:hypothetical protein
MIPGGCEKVKPALRTGAGVRGLPRVVYNSQGIGSFRFGFLRPVSGGQFEVARLHAADSLPQNNRECRAAVAAEPKIFAAPERGCTARGSGNLKLVDASVAKVTERIAAGRI